MKVKNVFLCKLFLFESANIKTSFLIFSSIFLLLQQQWELCKFCKMFFLYVYHSIILTVYIIYISWNSLFMELNIISHSIFSTFDLLLSRSRSIFHYWWCVHNLSIEHLCLRTLTNSMVRCVFLSILNVYFCTTMSLLKSTCMTYYVSALIKEHIYYLL